ncbi:hypothetical protein TWF730_002225 [Orbilia blumenaviensis]|uniref:Uncharacterized protein n=1 Tax=Orbilia blumenaviensis TaxID=1796055 RepID=A0AAV9UGF9_9PEZI
MSPPPPPLYLSTLPAFSLQKHLYPPSNPPPSGPLPRPPSNLENQAIAARLSASSPPTSTSLHPKPLAYPFPSFSDTSERDLCGPSNLPAFDPTTSTNVSPASQPSPLDSLLDGNSPLPVDRRPSAITQASSDALGENCRPSQLALPPFDQNGWKSSAGGSDYSASSLLVSHEEVASPKSDLLPHLARSVLSVEEIQHDSHSLGRLSRLSYVSGGAAFVVSEGDSLAHSNSAQSYRVDNVLPDFEAQRTAHLGNPTIYEANCQHGFYINSTLGNPRDSRLRIHPADNRFEHTYRVRKADGAEEPIYVPVYVFEPPGNFPDRSRLTAPLATPKFLNHTPRNFSLPGKSGGGPPARFSSDSAEMLLGSTSKFDGVIPEIRLPPRTYDSQRRAIQPFRKSVAASILPEKKKPKNSGQSSKETAHQRFEREHIHYFRDLDHLEESFYPAALIPPQIQIHGPKILVSRYGIPALRQPEDAYTGDEINEGRWPERYKRQKRIGRSLLCMCIVMPPLWLIMAAGLLDNLVAEMTSGEIWGVGRPEKVLAAWFGGLFCLSLTATIIAVGVIAL